MERCLARRPQRNRRRHFRRRHQRQACWTGQDEPIIGVCWGDVAVEVKPVVLGGS
jgi:hypothetical protein